MNRPKSTQLRWHQSLSLQSGPPCKCVLAHVCVCLCVFASMHNAVIIWMRDIGLPYLIMRKAVYWSVSQNRYSHRCKPGGKSKPHTPADPLWPTGHRWASLLLFPPPPIHAPSFCFSVNISDLHSLSLSLFSQDLWSDDESLKVGLLI